ncbi:hypothetical protein WG66_014665 [Moniliophthora roreri]|nr:hypothetical protein WG66_014665 [Moniliophthora roreri]
MFSSLSRPQYHYYTTFRGDKRFLRTLVYGLFFLDFAQTLMCTQFAWHYAVDIWNEPQELNGIIPWTAGVIPIVGGFGGSLLHVRNRLDSNDQLVSMCVQFFYAWRIWTLGKNTIMKGLACLICFVSFAQGMSAVVAGFIGSPNTTQQTLLRLHPAFSLWLAGSFVADVLITMSMFWILHNAKTNSSFARSEALINRLISNTIQTGALTVVVATVDLALFVRLTDATYHFVPAYILGKLYTNSFMAMLNARTSTSAGSVASSSGGTSSGSYGMMNFRSNPNSKAQRHQSSAPTSPGGVLVTQGSRTFVDPRAVQSDQEPEKVVDFPPTPKDFDENEPYKRGDVELGRI